MIVKAGHLAFLLLPWCVAGFPSLLSIAIQPDTVKRTAHAQESVDDFRNKLFEKAFNTWAIENTNPNKTMLTKSGHTVIPTSLASVSSPLPTSHLPRRLLQRGRFRSSHQHVMVDNITLVTQRFENGSPKVGTMKDQEQVKLRMLLMASVYGALGAFKTFLSVFLTSIIAPTVVGPLLSMQTFLGAIVNPLIAGFADIYQKHRFVMMISAFAQALLQLCLLMPNIGFFGITVVLFALTFFQFQPPTMMDTSTIAAVGSKYGSIRLWGSIGFGVLTLIAGGLSSLNHKLEKIKDLAQGHRDTGHSFSDFSAAFGLSSFLYLLSMIGFARLDVKALSDRADGQSVKPSTLAFIKSVLSMRTALFYLITVFSGVTYAFIDAWLNPYLGKQGASAMLMGCGRGLNCFAEVPFFRFFSLLRKRLGIAGCLAAAQIAYVCRFLWYASLPSFADLASNILGINRKLALWGYLPSETLHGLTFAVLQSTLVHFADSNCPDGMQSTSQSVAATMHWMLGYGIGASVGGVLFSKIGGQNTFKVGAAFSSANFGLCILGYIAYGKEWDRASRFVSDSTMSARERGFASNSTTKDVEVR